MRTELVSPADPDARCKAANCIGALACVAQVACWIAEARGPAERDGMAIVSTLTDLLRRSGDNVYLTGDACFALGWLLPCLPRPLMLDFFDVIPCITQAFLSFHKRSIAARSNAPPATTILANASAASATESTPGEEAVSNALAYIAILLLKLSECLLRIIPADSTDIKKRRNRPSRRKRAEGAPLPPAASTLPVPDDQFHSSARRAVVRIFNCEFLEHFVQFCCDLARCDDLALLRVGLQVLTAVCCFKEGRIALMHCEAISQLVELRKTMSKDELALLEGVLQDLKHEAIATLSTQ